MNMQRQPQLQPQPLYDQDIYEQDFYAWSQRNAALLRKGRFSEIDFINIAEEIEDMGINIRHALASRLEVLLMHLLKWEYQPERRSRSWKVTIAEQRIRIAQLLRKSPSLKHGLEDEFYAAYKDAVRLALIETGLDKSTFPSECPFTLQQCLDDDFVPES